MPSISPATDKGIAQNYTVSTLAQKLKNKTALQEKLGWPEENKQPLLCVPAALTAEQGGALFAELIEGLLTTDVAILILGKGSKEYGELCTDLAKKHKHRIAIIPNDAASVRSMLAASDMALFLHDPTGSTERDQCLQYGVVPVAPQCKALESYDPIQESGYAFLYEKPTTWHVFAAVVRALENQQFPFDWRTIHKHCMKAGEQ